MSRILVATIGGVIGFLGYVVAAVTLAGHVAGAPVLVEFAFYLVAGLLWVLPARRLMVWASRG